MTECYIPVNLHTIGFAIWTMAMFFGGAFWGYNQRIQYESEKKRQKEAQEV